MHENTKRESEKFQQENQKCRQESERVQQEIKERFQRELQEKKEEIEVLQEAIRAENVKVEQEIERKRKEIQVLRETIRNENVKFQQEILHCQQQHYEEIKEKNQAIITITKESKQSLLRGKLEFTLCLHAFMHAIFLIDCSSDELWELLKPYSMQWYQLGIKFGVERRDL